MPDPSDETTDPLEAQLADSFANFRQSVDLRLGATALDVWDGDMRNHTFRMSLMSLAQQLKGIHDWRNSAGDRLRILAGFVDIMLPNALADRASGTHLVAIYTPLFVALQEFSMFCFTQQDFFRDVGAPPAESAPLPDGDVPGMWLLRFTLDGGKVAPEHSQTLTPTDDTRYAASLYLGFLMARFVWFHEYAHCFNGHVDYVQAEGLALRLHEVAEPLGAASFAERTDQRSDTLRALELDADEAALWASWQVQATGRENFESFANFDIGLRKRLALFGAYAMTWLFEEFQNFMDARHGLSHPAPYLRLQNMLGLSRQRFTSDEDRAVQASVESEFDRIAAVIPGMDRTAQLMRDLKGSEASGELARLQTRLTELRPELAHYRFASPDGS